MYKPLELSKLSSAEGLCPSQWHVHNIKFTILNYWLFTETLAQLEATLVLSRKLQHLQVLQLPGKGYAERFFFRVALDVLSFSTKRE